MFTTRHLLTLVLILLSIVGVATRAYTMARLERDQGWRCGTDFPVFYAGGQLVGSPLLYSWKAMQAREQSTMGCGISYAVFIRLPYFAALMKPWSLLPFWPAFWLWRAALVISIGVFILLWPAQRRWSLLACAWSLPLHYAVTNGQDDPFLLMWLALAVVLLTKGWEFAAGCALAMCAAKFHLFILLPVLLIYWRRMLMGWMTASAVIFLSCFAIAGLSWPKQLMAAIGDNVIDRSPATLPNLRGLAHSSVPLEILLAASVLVVALYVIHRGDFRFGLSAVLLGGILLSHHLIEPDAALLIPVALMLAWHPEAHYSKLAAIYLASPLAYFMMGWVQALAMLLLLYLMAFEVWAVDQHSGQPSEGQADVLGARRESGFPTARIHF